MCACPWFFFIFTFTFSLYIFTWKCLFSLWIIFYKKIFLKYTLTETFIIMCFLFSFLFYNEVLLQSQVLHVINPPQKKNNKRRINFSLHLTDMKFTASVWFVWLHLESLVIIYRKFMTDNGWKVTRLLLW